MLDAVFNERFGKKNCFVARQSAFCGNNIVEEDEECDCGYMEDCQVNCYLFRSLANVMINFPAHACCLF